jgi:ABC-type glycerol-3-phosphate transport system permease component
MIVSAWEKWAGRIILVLLMVITVVPFVSLFITALHPAGTYPPGLAWPETPHWENFVLGVFFRGETSFMTGLQVAPEVPLEEVFFLTLLCYLTMNVYGALDRRPA